MGMLSTHGSWGGNRQGCRPHDRAILSDQPFLLTSQKRKMNAGSRVSSTPSMPAP